MSDGKETLFEGTHKFWFLPIHFACYKGASHNIIKALLDADNDGYSDTKRTKCQKFPLHLVVIKKLPAGRYSGNVFYYIFKVPSTS